MSLSSKLFKIEANELGKVLDFAMLGAILQAGISIGLTAADTIFLTKIGADKLPYIYLFTPLIFLVYIPIYSYLTSKVGVQKVFELTISILAAGGIAIYLMLHSFEGELAVISLYLVKLYSILWYIAIYTLFWNFVDGFFNILDAKRIFSALGAGSALGAALGGGLVSILSSVCTSDEYFLIWSLLAVCAFPVLKKCTSKWKLIEREVISENKSHSIVAETKSLIKTFRTSSFAIVLGSLLFLTMVVTLVCEYQYSHILSQGRSEEELARLFGNLFFVVHSINLFINLFVFNRLVLRFGVRNVAMIQPLVYVSAFVFFIFDYSFLAGVFGFFAFHGILTSIDFNNTNLLINALPKENKRQLRTFIEGICEPMANAVAGAFLIFLVASISPAQISTIGLITALLCFGLSIVLRSAYIHSMVSNLKKSWLDFSGTANEIVKDFQENDLRYLETLAGSGSSADSIFALQILALANDNRALPAVLNFIAHSNKNKQAEAAGILNEIMGGMKNKPVIKLAQWVENNIENLHPGVLEIMAEHNLISELQAEFVLGESHNKSTAVATIALKGIQSVDQLISAFELIRSSLDGNSEEKCSSLRAMAYSANSECLPFLVPFLKDQDANVQLEACRAIEKLAGKESKFLIDDLIPIISNGSQQLRLSGLDCFSKIGDLGTIEELLKMSESFCLLSRRKLETIIVQCGLSCVPVAVKVVKDDSFSYRARSIAARALAKLSAPQLEAISSGLIFKETSQASLYSLHAAIFSNAGRTSPGQEVLAKHCADQKQIIIDFVLEILALNGRVANFELLLANLRSSNQKERADAIETIQQACDSKTNKVILPLISSVTTPLIINCSNEELYACLKNSFESKNELEAAAAAEALSSLGFELGKKAETDKVLREKLASFSTGNMASSMLVDSIVSALVTSDTYSKQINLIRKIAHLQQSEILKGFSSEDLKLIAEGSLVHNQAAGSKFNLAFDDYCYLLLNGNARSLSTEPIRAYNLLGENKLFGLQEAEINLLAANDLSMLAIPLSLIQQRIENDASLVIYLLSKKPAPEISNGEAAFIHPANIKRAGLSRGEYLQ